MQIIEVTATGFDGATDDTDDRVLWILAPDVRTVKTALSLWRAPYLTINETDLIPANVHRAGYFDMTTESGAIVAALYGFAVADMGAALDSAESFISGFEGDDMQEGIDDMLSKVRAAQSIANMQPARYTVTMRGTNGGTDTETITVHPGQDAEEEAARTAAGYGATVEQLTRI